MAVLDTTFVSDEELLQRVKDFNDYGENDFSDKKLKIIIKGVKTGMLGEGIPEVLVNSESAVDVIALMVDAIKSNTEPIPYCRERMTQLRMVGYE